MATVVSGWREREWWQEAVVARWLIARHVPLAGGGLVAALLAVNVVLGVLPVVFVIATSELIGQVPAATREGVGTPAWNALVAAFLLAGGCFAGQQLLTSVQTSLAELARRRIDGVVVDRLIETSLRSTGIGPLEDPDVRAALAEVTRRIETGRDTPGAACAGLLALVARYLRLAGFVVLVGVSASWLAAGALFVAVMVFRYGQRGGMRKYSRVWRDVAGDMRRGEYLRELAMGQAAAKEIRVFGLASWLGERYASNYLGWTHRIWRARRQVFLFPYLGYTAFGLVVTAAVLIDIGYAGATGRIDLAALALGLQATLAAVLLGEYYAEADRQTTFGLRAALGAQRFDTLVRAAEPTPVRTGLHDLDPAAPTVSVRFDGVSFRYPGQTRPVLDGLDLELPAGKCTAIVGVNGAGKTTLVKLLTRLYEPDAGCIRIDGVDVRQLDLSTWRRRISVIFQDFVRYELPAADNIALGAAHRSPDGDEILRAAERAGVADTLAALPGGLGTPLSRSYTGGTDLSGGQWQRVAIARSMYALAGDARILVLDEPTSALDIRAEEEFFNDFVANTRGVTSLLISHRFSSVRRADRIVVLDNGRVLETGTHDELMALDGRYAALFRLQAERFAAGLDADGEILDDTEAIR